VDAELNGTALRSFAQDRLVEAEQQNMQRKAAQNTLQAVEQDLERRRADLAANAAAREECQTRLSETLAETWIDLQADPETVREILNRLPDLLKAQTELQTATRRLAAMDENHRNGVKVLEQLRSLIDPDSPTLSEREDFVPEAEALIDRLGRAVKLDETRDDLNTRCEAEQTAIDKVQAELAAAHAAIADLQQKFDTTAVNDLRIAIQKGIARGVARSEVDRHERDLLTALKVTDLDEALTVMTDLDDVELSAQKDALLVERNIIDQEREGVWRGLTLARKTLEEMSSSDEIARMLQDRESLKSELADLVRDYMRLRAGERVLSWALTRFRQTNKAPMLAAAGRFFARMTQGQYVELITQPGDKGDILAAVDRDDALKTVDALSEGTCHQLFLALRMAGYLELSKDRDVPPLILDDILSSSDNERAAAMLEALAELAEVAQVIVLTHHAHVVDIASNMLADRFTLHRLTETPA
jgi:uncharacterized protein YhaN